MTRKFQQDARFFIAKVSYLSTLVVMLTMSPLTASQVIESQRLVDSGLNSDTQPLLSFGLPNLERWMQENAVLVAGTQADGVEPIEGDGMLAILRSGASVSQVRQRIDVSSFASEIDQGRVQAYAIGALNASVGGTSGSLIVRSFDFTQSMTDIASKALPLDGDTTSWEKAFVSLPLPVGTRFVEHEFAFQNATLPIGETGYSDAAGLVLRVSSPNGPGVFIDNFDDGVVDMLIYTPLNGATLNEVNGSLIVTPGGVPGGVRIDALLAQPPPLSEESPSQEWRYVVDILPEFSASNAGVMTLTSRDIDSRVIEQTLFDNATGNVVRIEGNPLGGTTNTIVGPLLDWPRAERKRVYRWIPPTCKGPSCDYGFDISGGDILIAGKWRFSAAPPVDPDIRLLTLGSVTLETSEPNTAFEITHFELNVSTEQTGFAAWELSPTRVRSSGGDVVTLTGSGFNSLGAFSLTVDGVSALSVSIVDDSTIIFTAPFHSRGLVDVGLTTTDGVLDATFDSGLRYYGSVTPLVISIDALPNMFLGIAPSFEFSSTGGVPPYSYQFLSGQLPAGVSIQSDGQFVGSPAKEGLFGFYVAVTDQSGEEDIRFYFLNVGNTYPVPATSLVALLFCAGGIIVIFMGFSRRRLSLIQRINCEGKYR